jgi:hypothetical protein
MVAPNGSKIVFAPRSVTARLFAGFVVVIFIAPKIRLFQLIIVLIVVALAVECWRSELVLD